jgi:alpha-L-fucosidase
MKDICGLWKKAADNHRLPFGLTEHLGASFSWFNVTKSADENGPYAGVSYDGNDPTYRDFYFDNYEHTNKDDPYGGFWYTYNDKFHDYWLSVVKEFIDLYTPDFLYTDGGLPFGFIRSDQYRQASTVEDPFYKYGLEAVAYLYNKSINKHGENRAVYTQKDRRKEIYSVGILDIEKSQLPGISPDPWHTDTCIGNWFYDVRNQLKKPGYIIEKLVDVVSKNATMLLNILQRPDGSIDDEAGFILREMASWNEACGEGIYETRPWRIADEGPSSVRIDGYKEEQIIWTESDFRFTARGKIVYVFIMKIPENRSLAVRSFNAEEKVVSVRLLGGELVPFSQNHGILTLKLPEKLPTVYTNCLAVELA